jgi:hypothetical protein
MTVDRYVTTSTGGTWAVGTAHTRGHGDVYGYVVYNTHTFRNSRGHCV